MTDEVLQRVAQATGYAPSLILLVLAALQPGDELASGLRAVSTGSPDSKSWTVADLLATARQEAGDEMCELCALEAAKFHQHPGMLAAIRKLTRP